jgi:hypothetical protein
VQRRDEAAAKSAELLLVGTGELGVRAQQVDEVGLAEGDVVFAIRVFGHNLLPRGRGLIGGR